MKNKHLIVALLFSLVGIVANAQDKYYTKTGKIEFFSKAKLEDIEAKNKTATAILDTKTGALQFSVLMKGFEFERALMQEHFNENYVESDKFPKAEFKGSIINHSEINYGKEGTYNARVRGKLSIHGVTRDVETTGTIRVDDGKLHATSVFSILLSDYNIRIPSVVKDKLSNNIRISVDCRLEPLKG